MLFGIVVAVVALLLIICSGLFLLFINWLADDSEEMKSFEEFRNKHERNKWD